MTEDSSTPDSDESAVNPLRGSSQQIECPECGPLMPGDSIEDHVLEWHQSEVAEWLSDDNALLKWLLDTIITSLRADRDWHASCREAAVAVYRRLDNSGIDARIVCGGLDGIAPSDWSRDDPPCKGRHFWTEAIVDGEIWVVEPNSSSRGRAGDPAAIQGRPEDYHVYPQSVERGMELLSRKLESPDWRGDNGGGGHRV